MQAQPLHLEPQHVRFRVLHPEGQQYQDVRLRNIGVATERFRSACLSAWAICMDAPCSLLYHESTGTAHLGSSFKELCTADSGRGCTYRH